ncbi:RidA family protein [Streptosporangium sp. 'caverna']|uniref:RidA family protein n=1 Tax=Streptosporangium sp. 'caverna' TaxID=2202249 RepID=UPI001EF7747C|nr:RidA family protein [Streptosporangium sp. 'caverna']
MIRRRVSIASDRYEPDAISPAIRVGDLVFASGQAGFDENGVTVSGGFEPQARQAFANLDRVLTEAGSSLADSVKVTIMVTDLEANLETIVKLRGEFFAEPYPAYTLTQISRLAQADWEIEIDATAVVRRRNSRPDRRGGNRDRADASADLPRAASRWPTGQPERSMT